MPPSNLSKDEQVALKQLQKEPSIIILPADKGKATVVMDKEDYISQATRMLSEERTYEKLSKDPTQSDKEKLRLKLKKT